MRVIGALLVVSIAVLGACTNHARLPPGALEPCTEPSETVPVEELGMEPWRSCDMAGLEVVFPDGAQVEVPDPGALTRVDDLDRQARSLVRNQGVLGTLARFEAPGVLTYWGTDEGIDFSKALEVTEA